MAVSISPQLSELFHPVVCEWFESKFATISEPQEAGWPIISQNKNVLVAAPTGSGKTLTAFLVCLDRLLRQWMDGNLENGTQIVYVSPLKALSNDIERNLQQPLFELTQLAEAKGLGRPEIRVAVRTGDTPSSKRQQILRRPPHILVTTPESLYLMLTAERARETLTGVNTVIVDEIHALARDKRGSHLALTLERLNALCDSPPVRIGLSATQRPLDMIANFLVGDGGACEVVDVGHVRKLSLHVEVPPTELSAVCSHEQWGEVYQRLADLIQQHRSTLVFVNTRRLAERIAHHLVELVGEDGVASHHGSLSRPLRLDAEQRLKEGKLKAIVATASLELGIDVGYIDLVCQVGSPRSIATFLQRIGRSGHSLGKTPQGRLFPLTTDELLECLALVRAVKSHRLDAIEIPECPLDILAQQVVAETATGEWETRDLFDCMRRAWPYRNLEWGQFKEILEILTNGMVEGSKRGTYLHWDRINDRVRAKRGARLAAITSGGAIPENAEYRVIAEEENTLVGTVDEDFAIESSAGDVFLLGNTSWRVRHVRGGDVVVYDAEGAPPTIPFWFGEAPGRTVELSEEVARIRTDIADGLSTARLSSSEHIAQLDRECSCGDYAAEQAIKYVSAQREALGLIPDQKNIVFERFFDESGGMQLVIHAPLGARINRAWGLALRKRFCRSFDFELQAAAIDNGVLLSLSPNHSFPVDSLFSMIGPQNAKYLLEQAVLAVPMFQVRWRWNATRALAILRRRAGKKVPPHLQRFQADDLLAAAFPETVGCLENHHGDVEIPDHPLVKQTMHDCMTEAMDLPRWLQLITDIKSGAVNLVARDTREPSPFCQEILNANPYAFLDDAPLEERRTRAVSSRGLGESGDLSRLDEEAIVRVRADAWPLVRDADELHEALLDLVVLRSDEVGSWSEWLKDLIKQDRARYVTLACIPNEDTANEAPDEAVELPGVIRLAIASERWPLVRAAYQDVELETPLQLPVELESEWDGVDARTEIVDGRMSHAGPMTARQLSEMTGLPDRQVAACFESLEGRGSLLRGQFVDSMEDDSAEKSTVDEQWCQRNLLARIHRLTLAGLRAKIEPVSTEAFVRFLLSYHKVGSKGWGGPVAVRDAISKLQGFEVPAIAWESKLLSCRVHDYDSSWLDELFSSGEMAWGRLRPPKRNGKKTSGWAFAPRVMPISLFVRESLPMLVGEKEPVEDESLSHAAQSVLAAMTQHGALFKQQLVAATKLLPDYLNEALKELVANGCVNNDTFQAIRSFLSKRRTRRRPGIRISTEGRWACFPGFLPEFDVEQHRRAWCHVLLNRYGVLFRDLVAREPAAPRWYELIRTLRRMELAGEVRGGRFIKGVAGEQYALEGVVERLREHRDPEDGDEWYVLSAVDPLNLDGLINDRPKIKAIHKNRLILWQGRCVATYQADEVNFLEDVPKHWRDEMKTALIRGERVRSPQPN